jgi:hypothetical protein
MGEVQKARASNRSQQRKSFMSAGRLVDSNTPAADFVGGVNRGNAEAFSCEIAEAAAVSAFSLTAEQRKRVVQVRD